MPAIKRRRWANCTASSGQETKAMAKGIHQKRNSTRRRPNKIHRRIDNEDYWSLLCEKYGEVNHWEKKVKPTKENKSK